MARDYDIERRPHDHHLEDSEPNERQAFVRKVYTILMLQLMFSFLMVSSFKIFEGPRYFVLRNPWLFWLAFAVTLVMLITLSCCDGPRRTPPCNYICLFIFTLAEAFLISVSALHFSTDVVMISVGATAAVCFALTIFAMQTRCDFTAWGGALLAAVVILMVFGLIAMFIPGRTVMLVYCSLGVMIFSMVLIYDTQLMLGGDHKYALAPDEHVFAALSLYIDIINIFMYLMMIFGLMGEN